MKSQGLKLAVAIVVLVAAGAIYHFRSVESPPAETEDSAMLWCCRECHHSYKLTPSQTKVEAAKAGSEFPLICPKCGKKEAYRALICEYCETMYFGNEVPGSTGACPKCFPPVPNDPRITTPVEKPAEKSVPVEPPAPVPEEEKPVPSV